jgi:hypothetical protein
MVRDATGWRRDEVGEQPPSFAGPDRLAHLLARHGVEIDRVEVRRRGDGLVDFQFPGTDGRIGSGVTVDPEGRVSTGTVRFPLLDGLGRSRDGVQDAHEQVVGSAQSTPEVPGFVRTDDHNRDFAPHFEFQNVPEEERVTVRAFGNFVGALVEEYERAGIGERPEGWAP